jgi:hypothetical protein
MDHLVVIVLVEIGGVRAEVMRAEYVRADPGEDGEAAAGLTTPERGAAARRVVFTESAECAICLERHARGAVALRCGHSFHAACADAWLRRARTCPLCRAVSA